MMELSIRYYRGCGRVGSCDSEGGGDDALSVGRVGLRYAGESSLVSPGMEPRTKPSKTELSRAAI